MAVYFTKLRVFSRAMRQYNFEDSQRQDLTSRCNRNVWGRDSSVGVATRYGLDDPGVESRWGRDLPHSPRPALGPTNLPVQWVPGLFSGGKVAGA
jgi:hypothetical protein